MIWFSDMPGARNICMGVPSFILCAFSLNGRASLIRFVRARGKLVETVSLYGTLCTRLLFAFVVGFREFSWNSEYIGKTIETDLINSLSRYIVAMAFLLYDMGL